MRRTILVAPCLLALACGGAQTNASVEELRATVPQHAWLEMALPAVRPPGQGACAASGASTFGTLTHRVAGTADGVLVGVFGVVAQVTSQAPAASSPGHAAWVIPGTSAVYRLIAQQSDAANFQFVMSGEPPGSGEPGWKDVFAGATRIDDPQRREGEVLVDFGVMHALDASVDPTAGQVRAHFVLGGSDARDVAATFTGIVGKNAPQPDDSAYAFVLATDQSADFAFSTRIDFDGDGTLDELLHIDSHWATDGRGVAHGTVTGGSLGQRTVTAIECWDGALQRVYYTDDAGVNASQGDRACCPL
jgi:hypothetical protein